jgi:hypothetical protein
LAFAGFGQRSRVAMDIFAGRAMSAIFAILADAISAMSDVFELITRVAEPAVGNIATDRAITSARLSQITSRCI